MLYVDEIIEALLGRVPQNFYAILAGYSVHKAGFDELPQVMQDLLNARKNFDRENFSYLFVKPSSDSNAIVEGRAYAIDLEDELILDRWEHYPDWYRKQAVAVQGKDGQRHEAFLYTLDIAGQPVENFKRVVNGPENVLAQAKATRHKFPQALV